MYRTFSHSENQIARQQRPYAVCLLLQERIVRRHPVQQALHGHLECTAFLDACCRNDNIKHWPHALIERLVCCRMVASELIEERKEIVGNVWLLINALGELHHS